MPVLSPRTLCRVALGSCLLLLGADAINAIHFNAGATGAKRELSSSCSRRSMSFQDFVTRFGRDYLPGSTEWSRREQIFEGHVVDIERHNCGERTWRMGVNHLTDWTGEELQSLRGYKNKARSAQGSSQFYAAELSRAPAVSFPETHSWGNLSSIKEPRDQGQCGSCWAFAAHTAMRAHAELKGRSTDFSVSQLVSCTPNPGACGGEGGCQGATAELAFDYVLHAGLVNTQESPYSPPVGACPADRSYNPATTVGIMQADGNEVHMTADTALNMHGRSIGMVGWTKFAENQEFSMVRALVEEGPLAIAVAAGPEWSWYYEGIMTPSGCDPKMVISHAVVLFGYGAAGSVKFWRIKNSWGREWGEEGNLRLQRLDQEEKYCGWDHQPELGSGCKGGPPKVWVCGSCGILYDVSVPHFVSAPPPAAPGAAV